MICNVTELFYVEILLNMNFELRAKAEGIAVFIRSILIYYLIKQKYGLLAYAIGELVDHSFVFLFYFWAYFGKTGYDVKVMCE